MLRKISLFLCILSLGWNANGQSNISAGEYFIGTLDPGAGSGTALTVTDGNWDEFVENVQATLSASGLNSPTLLNVRLRDGSNAWGPVFKKTVFFNAGSTTTRPFTVTQAEYFFGTLDPGAGQATPMLAFDGAFDEALEAVVKTAASNAGIASPTLLNVRLRDGANTWGPVFKKTVFFNAGSTTTRPFTVTQAEYFFGTLDPGAGQATPMLAFDGAYDEALEAVVKTAASTAGIASPTLINVRLRDGSNAWGPVFKKTVFFDAGSTTTRPFTVTQAEYFFGTLDPGAGQATPIIAADGAFDEALESVLRTQLTWGTLPSPTLFNVRLKDGSGNWGPLFKKTIFPNGANPNPNLIQQGSTLTVCPNASVTLNYSGPNGYSPTWFDGSTNSSVTFNVGTPGYYSVAANLGAASYVDSIYIGFHNVAVPTVSPSGTIVACASSNTILNASSIPNASYQWYFNGTAIAGATVTTYIPSQLGSYYVTATTSANGCTGISDTTTLTTTASISPSGTVTTCQSSLVLAASQGSGATYQWRNAGTPIAGATGSTYTVTQNGSYSVVVTNGSCSATAPAVNVTLGTGTTPTVTASGPTTFCQGGSVTLTSSSATGNLWSNGATTQSITVNQAGSYTVTATSGQCSGTSSATTVVVNPQPAAPTVTASGPTTFCQGGSVTLTSSSATGNLWSNGATTQSITVSQAGTYSVTVTSNGCTATSSATTVTVTSVPAPTVTASGPTTFCQGGSVTLTSSSATGNLWSNGATTQSITVSQAGTYSVTVTSNGCTATSSATTVVVTSITNPPTITGPNTVVAYATHTYAVSQTANHTYQWTVTGGALLTGQGTNVVSILWSNAAFGSIRVVESLGTCSEDDTLLVDISGIGLGEPEGPSIQINPNPGSGIFQLSVPEELVGQSYVIYDMSGRQIAVGRANAADSPVDLSNVATGVYQLYMALDSRTYCVRVIVSR